MRNTNLVELLINKGYKISFAESCTGGMVSASIVDVPAASKVIDMSFVTYSNESKIELLDVDPKLIEQYGVVSEEVAAAMAIGCSKKAKSDIGVGVSGIAGPTGQTPTKPIGMVCFGFYLDGKIYTETIQFGNIGRLQVRVSSVEFVINYLIKLLSEPA